MPTLTLAEIDATEAEIGARLPSFYRQLLVEVGHGQNGDWEIYHPIAVRELYEPFFDDPAQLFNPYFPFGCNNHLQELWIIDASAGRAASIGHETVPEDWSEEKWLTFDDWRKQYLPNE